MCSLLVPYTCLNITLTFLFSRLFINQAVLDTHFKSKPHKRRYKHTYFSIIVNVITIINRLKELKDKPYTLEEASAAGGCGSNDFYALQMNTK